jgi:hypothetical protein
MQITILDHENNRTIIGRVPTYLSDADYSSDDIANAILIALGISGDTEYMIGDFDTVLADHNADSNREERGLELLTQDFKADALAALQDSQS